MTFNEGHKKEQMAAHDNGKRVRPLVPIGENPFTHKPEVQGRVREYERRMGSDNLTVRLKALKELEDMGTGAAPALHVIANAIHDDKDRIRELAAQTLGNIGGTDALNALREALSHEDDSRVIISIKGAISRIEHPSMVQEAQN